MTRPASALTRLRIRLARALEPRPDPGEAWCLNCAVNNGRTLVLSVDGKDAHLAQHGDERIEISATWPVAP